MALTDVLQCFPNFLSHCFKLRVTGNAFVAVGGDQCVGTVRSKCVGATDASARQNCTNDVGLDWRDISIADLQTVARGQELLDRSRHYLDRLVALHRAGLTERAATAMSMHRVL